MHAEAAITVQRIALALLSKRLMGMTRMALDDLNYLLFAMELLRGQIDEVHEQTEKQLIQSSNVSQIFDRRQKDQNPVQNGETITATVKIKFACIVSPTGAGNNKVVFASEDLTRLKSLSVSLNSIIDKLTDRVVSAGNLEEP